MSVEVVDQAALEALVQYVAARDWEHSDELSDLEHEAFGLSPFDPWPSWALTDEVPEDYRTTLQRVAAWRRAQAARELVDELVALRAVRP